MKKILLLFSALCSVNLVRAQMVNADCIQAINLCNSPSFTFFATSGPGNIVDFTTSDNISNPTSDPFPPNYGCLKSGELNPQWLLVTIGNAGSLEFVFGAKNSQNPQAGCYDWSMWPYNDSTCKKIKNNTLPPIRCNWNGTCQNGTGLASKQKIAAMGWDSSNFEPPLQVNACDKFIICISNYSGVNSLVSFESVGTASIACSANQDYSICAGSSATIVPLNCGGLTNPVFSLQPGGQSTSSGSFVVSPQVSTTYTTYVTGNNPATNAVETLSALSTVTVYQQPAIAPTVTNTSCTNTLNAFNLNMTLTPVTASNGYTVTWSPQPAGVPASPPTQTKSTDSIYVAPGVYNVTITTFGGCSTSGSFTIAPIPSAPSIAIAPGGPTYSITCFEPTVTVTALEPSYSYTWSNGLIAQQTGSVAHIDFSGLGTWTVTGIHPVSGCMATRTITIGQNTSLPSSAITPTFQNITCTTPGSLVVVTANSPTVNFAHQILSPMGGTFAAVSQTAAYQPGSPGSYTYHLVNLINGCRATKTFTVASSDQFPVFALTSGRDYTLGCNDRAWADLNITNAQASPGNPGAVTYSMLIPPGSSITPATGSTVASYTIFTPGTYTMITRNSANGCETKLPVSITTKTVPPSIDSVVVPQSILSCFTQSMNLRGISFSPNVKYSWKLPANQTKPGEWLDVFVNMSNRTETLLATYTLEVEDMSSTCINTREVPVLQNLFEPIVQVSASDILSCRVNSVLLTNNSTWGEGNPFPKPAPVIALSWSGPSPQPVLEKSTSYVGYYPGTYTMVGMDMNNGCTGIAEYELDEDRQYPIVNNPTVPAPDTLDCGNNSATVTPVVSNPTANLSYLWTGPPGAVFTDGSDKLQSLITNMVGEYRLLVTNTVNGCFATVKMIVVEGDLKADFEADVTSGFAPLDVIFHNNSTSSLGTESITAVWNFGNGADTILNSVSSVYATFTQPGIYDIVMYVQKGACIDTAFSTITVDIPSALEIPNVFTPNNDKVNDEFFLKTANLSSITMKIVDRWGRVVYELTSGTGNVLWDGVDRQGNQVPEGVYMFVLKATGTDGKTFEETGTITLLR